MKLTKKYIIILVILLIFSGVYLYDHNKYSEVTNLIEVDKINIVTSTYQKYGEEAIGILVGNEKIDLTHSIDTDKEAGSTLVIDKSENATLITVNNRDYIVDNNKLFEILEKYECTRSRKSYFPYESDLVDVEISLIQNYRPKHILLGEFNVWYESGDKGTYDIIDGDALKDEIYTLVEEISNDTGAVSPEERVELYFTYWNDKNDANMDSLVKESKRSADFKLQNLNHVTLERCVEREDEGGWSDKWFDDPYDYVCVDVSFTVDYMNGGSGGFSNGTYHWQYYLVKETIESEWMIVMWGGG